MKNQLGQPQQQAQRITTHSALPSSKRVKAKRRRDCDKPKTRPKKKSIHKNKNPKEKKRKRKTISEKMRLLDILASLGLSLVRRAECFQEWRTRPPMIQSVPSQLNEYLGDSAELMLRLHCEHTENRNYEYVSMMALQMRCCQ